MCIWCDELHINKIRGDMYDCNIWVHRGRLWYAFACCLFLVTKGVNESMATGNRRKLYGVADCWCYYIREDENVEVWVANQAKITLISDSLDHCVGLYLPILHHRCGPTMIVVCIIFGWETIRNAYRHNCRGLMVRYKAGQCRVWIAMARRQHVCSLFLCYNWNESLTHILDQYRSCLPPKGLGISKHRAHNVEYEAAYRFSASRPRLPYLNLLT
jgi:hypothetical protein